MTLQRMTGIKILPARWPDDASAIRTVRLAVFVQEQGVPADLEMDGLDAFCQHVIALSPDGDPIGTGRIQRNGHMGRIAVLAAWRGRGIGRALVEALIKRGRKDGLQQVNLDSQVHARAFYEKLGFVTDGEIFLEAGIPHIRMLLTCVSRT